MKSVSVCMTRRWKSWRNCSLFAFTLVCLPQSVSRSAEVIVCFLQVIMSNFERTIKITTSEAEKQAAVFVVLDRTCKADIGGKTTKSEFKRQVLGTTKTTPVWRNQRKCKSTWTLWTSRSQIWSNWSLLCFCYIFRRACQEARRLLGVACR